MARFLSGTAVFQRWTSKRKPIGGAHGLQSSEDQLLSGRGSYLLRVQI